MLFFPFFPPYQDIAASKASVEEKSAEAPAKQARAISTRPVKIDVEKAVAVVLATGDYQE